MSVANLLQQSMSAHQASTIARNAKRPDAAALMEQAYRLRLDAHKLDPAHKDPAWEAEQAATAPGQDTHTALLAFYTQHVGKVKKQKRRPT